MGRVRVVGRRGEQGRCAYCRGALGLEEAPACDGCGTHLHQACRVELGGCPSIGCRHAIPRARRGVPVFAGGPAPDAARTLVEGARGAAPERVVAGRLRRERDAARPAEGRAERRRLPAAWARFGPYARMTVRTAAHTGVLLGLAFALLWALTHPSLAWEALTREKGGRHTDAAGVIHTAAFAAFGAMFGFFAVHWLRRLPAFWRRVGEVLDDDEVVPAVLRSWTVGSGKRKKRWVSLTPDPPRAPRQVRLEGILPPWWLGLRSGARVYVHGDLEGDGPLVLEFEDGLLALLDP